MPRHVVLFLVILFISAAAGESGWSGTLKERPLDPAHRQLTDEQDCQNCPATIALQTETTNPTRSTEPPPAFRDDFNEGHLDHERWTIIKEGDFRQSTVDVIPAGPTRRNEYRLRLGMDTIGTRDETLKYVGVRSANRFSLQTLTEISLDLDWNNQSNGSYLTVAVYLCPTATNTNPEREADWLRFEYVGVPPGQNARAVIAMKGNGTVRHLFTEGWPENRGGRHIGVQRIKMLLDTNGVTILENGAPLHHIDSQNPKFDSGYLYLVMSSHSNYPFRETYFDNISVMEK